jgi:leucyl aminopeptidase
MLFNIAKTSEKLPNTCLVQGVFEGILGDTLLIQIADSQVLRVYCGSFGEFTGAAYKKALHAMTTALIKAKINHAVCDLPTFSLTETHDYYWKVRQAVAVLRDATYQFTACKSRPEPAIGLQQVTFHASNPTDSTLGQKAILHGQAIADGMAFG